MLGGNKLNCFKATQVLGGLTQILIWRSEIAKGPIFRGETKMLGGAINPNDAMGTVAVQKKQFCFLTTWMENEGELYILMDYKRMGERVAWFYFLTVTFLLLAYCIMLLVLILHHFLIFFWNIPDDGFLWELRVGWISSWDKISFQDENVFVHIFHSSLDDFILGRKLFLHVSAGMCYPETSIKLDIY